jgi:hypothetical protein
MNEKTAIRTVLAADPSVSSLVGNRIYYKLLPENFGTLPCIVYQTRRLSAIHTLDKRNLGGSFEIMVKLISKNPDELETLETYVQDLLQTDPSTGYVDILLEGDLDIYDSDNDLFAKEIYFSGWIIQF